MVRAEDLLIFKQMRISLVPAHNFFPVTNTLNQLGWNWWPKLTADQSDSLPQEAHNVEKASIQRWFNVLTLNRCCFNVNVKYLLGAILAHQLIVEHANLVNFWLWQGLYWKYRICWVGTSFKRSMGHTLTRAQVLTTKTPIKIENGPLSIL